MTEAALPAPVATPAVDRERLAAVGFVLPSFLIIAGVFALPLVIDKEMEFWPAMEVSRQVVHAHWWSMFGLMIVLAVVVLAGFLACGVGALISVPVAAAAFMYVYEDFFGELPAAPQVVGRVDV